MVLAHSKLTAQGQVSVPAKVREKLGVGPGSVLEWDEDGERVVVRKAGRFSSEEIHRVLFSKLPRRQTVEEMKNGTGGTSKSAMRAVDTNVLVRLMTRNDAKQVAAAEVFVVRGAWVPHLAIAEAIWVVASVYDRDPEAIATAVEMLLSHEQLAVQDAAVIAAAVAQFRQQPRLDFRIASWWKCSESGARAARHL